MTNVLFSLFTSRVKVLNIVVKKFMTIQFLYKFLALWYQTLNFHDNCPKPLLVTLYYQLSVDVTSSNHCLKASHNTCGKELMSLSIM